MSVIVYGLKNCDSCKKARNWLQRFEIEYEFIDYRENRIEPATLKQWAATNGWDAMINRSSSTWRQLPKARQSPQSDPEWCLLLKEYPALLKRPILLKDEQISQGFSDNSYKRLFSLQKS